MLSDYICVDLETTGLNPKTDKIIEIGAVKVRGGCVVGTFQSLVNPRRPLEERITELTGIREADLADQPLLDEVFPEFLAFAEDLPLLGHSVLFDYSFLKKAAVDRKITFERQGVDTLRIARKYLPELESRGLGFLCKHYQISHKAHRALGDAEATVCLYNILAEKFYAEDAECFKPSPLIYNVKRDQPASEQQKEKLIKLLEQNRNNVRDAGPDVKPVLITDEMVDSMSRSEASRMIDKILAKQFCFIYNGKLKY